MAKWIQKAIKKPGVFSAKAKSMGTTTKALAQRWKGKAGVWGQRARLALTLSKLSKPSKAARSRGGKKAARTKAQRKRR